MNSTKHSAHWRFFEAISHHRRIFSGANFVVASADLSETSGRLLWQPSSPFTGRGPPGPEQGERWWQRGSVFEKRIRELVTGEGGDLTFQPHVWDGKNSEVSREEAGKALFDTAKELEARKEPYCLVGHSHGGSVISYALLKAASKASPLTFLNKWITIATPFISIKKHRFLYSRVGLVGKAAYLTFSLTSLFFFSVFVLEKSLRQKFYRAGYI